MSLHLENAMLRSELRRSEAALAETQRKLRDTQERLDSMILVHSSSSAGRASNGVSVVHTPQFNGRSTRELSTSTARSAFSATSSRLRENQVDTPKLLAVLHQLVGAKPRVDSSPEAVATRVMQAWVRGFLQRKRYRECQHVQALVTKEIGCCMKLLMR